MAVRIRMKRLGRRHRPFYRICVMDSRVPRNGKAIEEVGTYDPMVRDKSQRVTLKMERIDHWISVGAKPSEKVAVLIRKVKENDWGEMKPLPPMQKPQEKKAPEPEAEAAAEEGGGEEAAAEEAPAEEAAES
jgi:small subunit ribosomal protein S16